MPALSLATSLVLFLGAQVTNAAGKPPRDGGGRALDRGSGVLGADSHTRGVGGMIQTSAFFGLDFPTGPWKYPWVCLGGPLRVLVPDSHVETDGGMQLAPSHTALWRCRPPSPAPSELPSKTSRISCPSLSRTGGLASRPVGAGMAGHPGIEPTTK